MKLFRVEFSFLHCVFCVVEALFLMAILSGFSVFRALSVALGSGVVHFALSQRLDGRASPRAYCFYLLVQSFVDFLLIHGGLLHGFYSLRRGLFSNAEAVHLVFAAASLIVVGLMAIRGVRLVWMWLAFWRKPRAECGCR